MRDQDPPVAAGKGDRVRHLDPYGDPKNASGRPKPRQFLGLAVLLLVVVAIAAYAVWPDPDPGPGSVSGKPMTVKGIGGGKVAFVRDPDVVRILRDKYGLTVDFERVGSIEQIKRCVDPLDYCWPSSQTAGVLIEENLGPAVRNTEIIFNSPIVMYTWAPIADALVTQGLVTIQGQTLYLDDHARLVEMIQSGTPWSDIGLPQLHGPVSIRSSDPTESNTGNSYAGLLANTLNGGQVVDGATIGPILPELQTFFAGMGFIPDTTTEMFEQFFTLGIGANPIIVAYESNLIEYCLANPTADRQQYLRDNVRTLYPRPTVWSSHPMIALTEGGQRLSDALRDPEIQRIGWEHHGFRTGLPGVANSPGICSMDGVPASIESIIPMPNPSVMQQIIDALEAPPIPTTPSTTFTPSTAIKREEWYV